MFGIGGLRVIHRSIEVLCSDTPFDQLPADIRGALRPEEVTAYRTGLAYFTDRAPRCTYRPMRKFFKLLGSAGTLRLHLYGGADPVYTAYFGFNLLGTGRYVQVRLGPAALPGDPPPGLAQIYKDIDGTIDGQENYGGWLPAADVRSVTARRWQPSHSGGCDPDHSYPVYGFGNGDYAGYAGPRREFLYTHEDGGRLEGYKLLEWAERYFGDYAAAFRS
jgi:hypothetical protein